MNAFIPSKVAEWLYALIIGVFASGHFMNTDAMGGIVPAGLPGHPSLWVYITGAGLGLAAIAILINVQKTLACYLLAAMLLIFAFSLHLKSAMDGNPGQLLKDSAMAMAAILIGNRK